MCCEVLGKEILSSSRMGMKRVRVHNLGCGFFGLATFGWRLAVKAGCSASLPRCSNSTETPRALWLVELS